MKNTKIIIAGDLMPMPCNYDLFEAGDIHALFGGKLCEMFGSADIRICNLEGCFTDSDQPIEKIGPNIKAPIKTIRAIKNLGIDYAALGNTHSMDYGREGYLDTCRTLSENGIGYVGWGNDVNSVKSYAEIKDGDRTVILYNTTERFENAPHEDHPGVNLYDEYRVCREIAALKKQCDFLIVLYHGGIEGTHYNSDVIRTRFHRMADSGADVIISQHTHAIGEQEHYNGAYLLYGQGNFCFHFRAEVTPYLAEGLVLELELGDNGFSATPHRILRTEKGCVYDDAQELSAFYERSKLHDRLIGGDREAKEEFERQFGEDCGNWAGVLFTLLHGVNHLKAKEREQLSPADYMEYIKKSYTRQQLLGIQMFMRNEEFNEIGNRILNRLLDEKE